MPKAQGLEYEERGDGEPVLLIHGALIATTFVPLMREAALAERYRLIRYHRRGHAGSDPLPSGSSLEEQAQNAAALMKHLGVERAHVVGHSGGGLFGTELAIQAPGLVHSLTVLEPAIMPSEMLAPFLESLAPAVAAVRAGDPAKAVDIFLSMVGGPDWRADVDAKLPGGAEQAERDAATFFEIEVPGWPKWISTFDRDKASRVMPPVLYGIGSESIPGRDASRQYFKSLVAQTEEVVIPGVDHSMLTTGPKLVAAAVADFLSRHPM